MKYKFATIDRPKSYTEKITVLDVPPQKRNITFRGYSWDLVYGDKSYFITLPRMHFHSYCVKIGGTGTVQFRHSVVFVDHDQYFYPALTNIDDQNMIICEPKPLDCYLDSELENDLDYYKIAVKHLDRFYNSIFTYELVACLDAYLVQKYKGELCEITAFQRQLKTMQLLKEWSDATKQGIDFDMPLIPISQGRFAFKNELKFRDPNEV